MKRFMSLSLLTVLLPSQQSLACSMTAKGWTTATMLAALKSIPESNLIKHIRIDGKTVVIEHTNPNGTCIAEGFRVTGDPACRFTATPDGAVRTCQ